MKAIGILSENIDGPERPQSVSHEEGTVLALSALTVWQALSE